MEKIQKTVIVVGAGISGLSCAYELLKNGFSVQILEARHIHGGRISKNSIFADFSIETGAEEIHLPTKYYKVAKEVGAKCESDSDFDSYIEDLPKKGKDLSKGSGVLIDEEDFYGKYKIQKFYKSLLKEEEKQFLKDGMPILEYFKFKQIDDRLIQFYETVLVKEYGSTLQEMSIKDYAEDELNWEYEEKRYIITMSHFDVIDRAFSTVFAFVKKKTPLQAQSSGVILVDAFGDEYKSDHVVVTVPVSQLKNRSINFISPLPQEKQKAIQFLQMGKGGKLHMKFKEKFWPNDYYDVVLKTQIGLIWNCSYRRSKKSLILCALISGQASIDMNDLNKRKQMMRTYTYPSLNLGLFRNILAQPVNNRIFFAGEATDTKYYVTIIGALDSGVREAQKIISLYKK
ncbi:hypothetical protein ABPG72_015273 [Tetrahymena utriculariae]